FGTGLEPHRTRREYNASNDDGRQEDEFSSRRGHGRARSSSSAWARPRRGYGRTPSSFYTGGTRWSPSYRRKSRFGRLGTYPIGVPEWPLFPITEGEPGGGGSREPESPGLPSDHARWIQSCLNQ